MHYYNYVVRRFLSTNIMVQSHFGLDVIVLGYCTAAKSSMYEYAHTVYINYINLSPKETTKTWTRYVHEVY